MKTIVVVPTIREDQIKEFLEAWGYGDEEFIIVQDGGGEPFDVGGATLYGWEDIDAELGDDAWIIPCRTDCIRSFGIWKAWQAGADVIVTMDDDVRPLIADLDSARPVPSAILFFDRHRANLQSEQTLGAWQSTIRKYKPRGQPFRNTSRSWSCVISHGLWKGVLDLDAIWQVGIGTQSLELDPVEDAIPTGAYFPMCGMNLAFTRAVAPLMYFGLHGSEYPYDRFGDIWCGIIAKRILDRFQLAVWSGEPYVLHERASNVWENLRKEQPGYEVNETFWERIDDFMFQKLKPVACYLELAGIFQFYDEPYFQKLGKAMQIWVGLFQ